MALLRSDLPLPLLCRGKVRDVYEAPGDRLLLVASDRVSAFDVIMREPVPGKGRVLTQLTAWWLGTRLRDVPHHLLSLDPAEIVQAVPALETCPGGWQGRSALVRRTRPFPLECVVRGYLSGSAWMEYRDSKTLAGEPLPAGLAESEALVPPVFSPATKAQEGHDVNITFAQAGDLIGSAQAAELRRRSLEIYRQANAAARPSGIIVADTKFEFGTAADGTVMLIDEVLTPDSSRFWPRDRYSPGRSQPSLDKQPIRDYLDGVSGWNKQDPPPPLPPRVVEAASERYCDLFRRLTGTSVDGFVPPRFDS